MLVMSNVSTNKGPLLSRYIQWSKTRYPLKNWIFSGLVYLAVVVFARSISGEMPLTGVDGLHVIAVGCFFLLLRIYDEHKDYQIDLKYHPERPVANGLIQLRELRYLFILALGIQALSLYWVDQFSSATSLAWAIAFAWSLLMAKEFFIGPWLQKRLLLYAISHMLVMVPLALWMILTGLPEASLKAAWPWLISSLVFFTGAIMEVARKTKSPVNEIQGVDSYSSILGAKGSVRLLLVMDLIFIGCLVCLLCLLPTLSMMSFYIAIGTISCVLAYIGTQSWGFLNRQDDGAGKKVEASQGLLILAIYLVMIVCSMVGGKPS